MLRIDLVNTMDGDDGGLITEDSNAVRFLKAFKTLEGEPGEVFTTRTQKEASGSKGEYMFITTERDLHLRLGQLPEEGQQHFARTILDAMASGKTSLVVLTVRKGKGGTLLVSLVPRTGHDEAFHLSRA